MGRQLGLNDVGRHSCKDREGGEDREVGYDTEGCHRGWFEGAEVSQIFLKLVEADIDSPLYLLNYLENRAKRCFLVFYVFKKLSILS